MCKNCLWRTWDNFAWNRINLKQSTVNLYLQNWRRGSSINQSEEEKTDFEDRFIYLSKILVDFRNHWNKEYLSQLREHFKHKIEKGSDICNKGDIVLAYEPNKRSTF